MSDEAGLAGETAAPGAAVPLRRHIVPTLQNARHDALSNRLAAIRAALGVSDSFPPEVEAEAAARVVAPDLPDADETAIPFVTIDPEGSTDLDQALHIERSGDTYRVRYAIADVPSFVQPGGAIDAEARRRGQTIYAADGRIPLHPVSISEGAASLLPDQLRSAFVWTFELDAAGTVTATTLARARIRSRRQYSYAEVQGELDAGTAEEPLRLLKEVGLARIALERARGGASLNRPDEEVVHDSTGYRIVRRAPLPVEGWNAQISLMTGMAAAEIMLAGRVGILRTMPAPPSEALEQFRIRVAALGRPWSADQPYGEYLAALDGADSATPAVLHVAGSLFRGAGYTAFDGSVPPETTQAAIAAPYAHATAPLRRLVDRFVLVTCEALANGRAVPDWVCAALPQLPAAMAASDGVAGTLERESVDAIEAAVLETRVGDVFDAVVVSVRGAGGGGVIQLVDPAVTATIDGDVTAGHPARAELVAADVASGTVSFRVPRCGVGAARPLGGAVLPAVLPSGFLPETTEIRGSSTR